MIARLGELRAFGLPLLIGLSRKRFIDFVSPSKPQPAHRRLDRRQCAGGARRRRHRARARRGRDRAGAARRGGDPGRRAWLKRCSGSAAMSATCARRSTQAIALLRRRQGREADRALVRLPHAALGRDRPAALRQSARSRSRPRLSPRALLDRALEVERALGRDRAREQRWGPRTIDIDLLAYDDLALDEPGLTLPHPRLFERAFVLVPLAEIVPDRVIGGAARARRAGADRRGGHREAARRMSSLHRHGTFIASMACAAMKPHDRRPKTLHSQPNFPPPRASNGSSWSTACSRARHSTSGWSRAPMTA